MKPCLIVEDTQEGQKRLERLQENVEVVPIKILDLPGYDLRGQYLIVPGVTLPRLDKDAQESLLRQQVDLLLIPPFPSDDLGVLLTIPIKVHMETGAFSSSKAIEDAFLSEIGQEALDIFFQKVVQATPSKSLLVTSSGQPLLVFTQARSNWGRLLITSLLLTSLSARSNETHKKLFWDGLSRWLAATAPVPIQPREVSILKPPGDDIRLPVFLLAVQIARKGKNLTEEDFQLAIEQVQSKLHQSQVVINLSDATCLLADQGILLRNSQGGWQVDSSRLSEGINRMHLAGYLRRLM